MQEKVSLVSNCRCLQLNVSAGDYFSLSGTVHVGVADGGQMCVFIGSDSDEAKG